MEQEGSDGERIEGERTGRDKWNLRHLWEDLETYYNGLSQESEGDPSYDSYRA